MKKRVLLLFLIFFISKISAQVYFPNNESTSNKSSHFTAFTNAKIYVTPSQIIEKGTLLCKEGKVMAVGNSVVIPKNAIVINVEGKSIYPSFIDMYTSFGVEAPKAVQGGFRDPMYDTKRKGYYWNEHVKAEVNAFESFKFDQSKAEEFLKAGFGVVNTHIPDGIARGTGALVLLNNSTETNKFLSPTATNHFAFTRSQASNQAYPSSLMGMTALVRQMYHDANWYKAGNSDYKDATLEALIKNQGLVQIFASEDKLNSLRASKIAKEFGLNYILKGSGNEFETH